MKVILAVSVLFGVALCEKKNILEFFNKSCGEITCGYGEYCNDYVGSCDPCSRICDEGPNRHILQCNQSCMEYIYEQVFVRREEPLLGEIHRLRTNATITFVFALVALIFSIATVFFLCLQKKKKLNIFKLNSKPKKKLEKIDISRKDMGLGGTEISTIRLPTESVLNMHEINSLYHTNPITPQTEFTNLTTFKNQHAREPPARTMSVYTNISNRTQEPLPKRMPSEDSTLEFVYDNPALAPSPVLNKDSSGTNERTENQT